MAKKCTVFIDVICSFFRFCLVYFSLQFIKFYLFASNLNLTAFTFIFFSRLCTVSSCCYGNVTDKLRRNSWNDIFLLQKNTAQPESTVFLLVIRVKWRQARARCSETLSAALQHCCSPTDLITCKINTQHLEAAGWISESFENFLWRRCGPSTHSTHLRKKY